MLPVHENVIKMYKFYEEGPIFEVVSPEHLEKKSKARGIVILELAENGTLIDHLLENGKMEPQ